MSPLWRMKNVKQLHLKYKKPSPKQYSVKRSSARSFRYCRNGHFFQYHKPLISHSFIKGTSLFSSLDCSVEASMTVEASIVLPLFLFFFLNLSCAIELIRLHGNLEFALCDVGNRLAVYGYVLTEQGAEPVKADAVLWEELKDVAFSYTFIKNEMVRYVGEAYLQEGPIADGVKGLQFWESELFGEEDCVEIVATYRVSPFAEAVGFMSFRMANRYYAHVWSGYEIPGAQQGKEAKIFYVAENGVVYHEDRDCSYLHLSIRSVTLQEAYNSRNASGERYTPCMRCYDEEALAEKVYITEDGENIHCRKDCGSLKRTVYGISGKETEGYRACGRCVQN